MAHSLQGVYAPLPQSLSDSDSEKEISMEPVCSNYGQSDIKNARIDTSSYRQNGHMDFSDLNDDVLRIKRVNPKMSKLRKIAFIFSIILCFLPIIIFLWVLPCSDSNTCPVKISNWEYQQDNIELQGKVNLVHGAFKNNLNLALTYRGSFRSQKSLKNGVMSFMGKNGAVAWDFQQESYPIKMNCSIIDVDQDFLKDCLVVDERSLKVIESVTGEAVWHAHSPEENPIPELEIPVVVDDFNNDAIPELISVYKQENLLLISGKDGLALSNLKLPPMCTSITNLTSNNKSIRYACRQSHKPMKMYELTYSELKKKYKNDKEILHPVVIAGEDKEVLYESGNRKLMVQNIDLCPKCRSIITLYHSNNTKLKSWSYDKSFVMVPVPFTFQSTHSNFVSLKGHVHGFIIKIWEWTDSVKKLSSASRIFKRNLRARNESLLLYEVDERFVLITFNDTNTHIVNASLAKIYQICGAGMGDAQSNCQPDHNRQKDSILIVDLDKDGSLELVSYSSTFVKKDEAEELRLVSYLKVFKLENELPKLFGTK